MDVLEHLPRPERTIRALLDSVASRAEFIVTLPNFVVWHVRLPILFGQFAYQLSGTLDRTHLRFYGLESAAQMLVDGGLQVFASDATWSIPLLGEAWSLAKFADDPHTERPDVLFGQGGGGVRDDGDDHRATPAPR